MEVGLEVNNIPSKCTAAVSNIVHETPGEQNEPGEERRQQLVHNPLVGPQEAKGVVPVPRARGPSARVGVHAVQHPGIAAQLWRPPREP